MLKANVAQYDTLKGFAATFSGWSKLILANLAV